MRLAPLAAAMAVAVAPAGAQEQLGTSRQAQTSAPIVDLQRPQSPGCGAAPGIGHINRLTPVVRRMVPQPARFDAGFKEAAAQPCHRNRVAAYLVRTIAAHDWRFAPAPGLRAPYPPLGAFPCGPAASNADLNVLIGRLRPLFADPAPFKANIAAIAKQPCIDGRATLYLVALIADNGLSFVR